MLTQADLKAIQSIVDSSKDAIISAVGEMIEENILPQFTQLRTELATQRTELLTQLPSKAFIADKLADLEGSVITRQRKEDQKVNLLIEFLQTKNVLAQDEVNMLKTFEVFPSRTTL